MAASNMRRNKARNPAASPALMGIYCPISWFASSSSARTMAE
jgi:hypothetical protein